MISATSVPVSKASKKIVITLNWVLCICYLIQFKKNKVQDEVQALINSSSKVNTITLGYISKIDLKIRFTNVGVQKFDGFTLKTFEIVLASFQMKDKLKRPSFFKKCFY